MVTPQGKFQLGIQLDLELKNKLKNPKSLDEIREDAYNVFLDLIQLLKQNELNDEALKILDNHEIGMPLIEALRREK